MYVYFNVNGKVKIAKSFEGILSKVPSEISFLLAVIIALKFVIAENEYSTLCS